MSPDHLAEKALVSLDHVSIGEKKMLPRRGLFAVVLHLSLLRSDSDGCCAGGDKRILQILDLLANAPMTALEGYD